ncbi:C40 family peptidase [Desulfovibrio inopinatus]|uniref:C40 family peptidase n=1 Tax=Desulfovibrio inopinatus TaxID=102109 RepID=UPI000404E9FA|nr:C40 family peptidase [Desulfovibrio inopinatus]
MEPLYTDPSRCAQWLSTLASYEGTPFCHGGRSKRRGVDCVGFVCGALVECGFAARVVPVDLSPGWQRGQEVEPVRDIVQDQIDLLNPGMGCEVHFPAPDLMPGDILFLYLRARWRAYHMAVWVGDYALHAMETVGVTRWPLDRKNMARVAGIGRLMWATGS